jgi:hypothetical protein
MIFTSTNFIYSRSNKNPPFVPKILIRALCLIYERQFILPVRDVPQISCP